MCDDRTNWGDLERKVSGALDSIDGGKTVGNPAWTREVKSKVAKLAQDAGDQAYASGADHVEREKEWLYDLTWLKYPSGRIERSVVALESEWVRDRKGIDSDFQKLLLVRADLRVMIFAADNVEDAGGKTKHMIDQIKVFQQSEKGDRYLFSCWLPDRRGFVHTPYMHGTQADEPVCGNSQ